MALCLSLFPWAAFRQHKAAIKLHTLLTLHGNFGNFSTVIIITPGSVHNVNIRDQLVWEAGAFYIRDRGYLDFARWHRIHQCGAFFVTRAKHNFLCARRYSRPVEDYLINSSFTARKFRGICTGSVCSWPFTRTFVQPGSTVTVKLVPASSTSVSVKPIVLKGFR
jgi:hypothetical protein